jgi:hypothetical protein
MKQRASGRGRKGTVRRAKRSTEGKTGRPERRVSTTMRLRQSLRKDLEAAAARNRRSVADIAQELLNEAVDSIELAHEAVATNTEHAGLVLVPPSLRGDEFQAITDAIFETLKPYRDGLPGLAVYIIRRG